MANSYSAMGEDAGNVLEAQIRVRKACIIMVMLLIWTLGGGCIAMHTRVGRIKEVAYSVIRGSPWNQKNMVCGGSAQIWRLRERATKQGTRGGLI